MVHKFMKEVESIVKIMGKLNVTILRYLTREDFRVLTAVSTSNYLKLIYHFIGL